MSVDEVVTIGEKFQTFQGAAEAAGSLNAILGGGFIDNIELMEASFEDPAGAALLLRDRIKESGMAIEDLGTMGIKAIGEKLGITDPATVRKFLQGDLTGEDLMKAANDPVVNSLEDLADQSQTLGQKQLNMMKDQTHELAKMVGGLDKIDETARGILSEIGGLTGTLILGVTQIVGAIMTRSAVSGELPVADLNPYEYRMQFIARTGGVNMNNDIDNIDVRQEAYSAPPELPPLVQLQPELQQPVPPERQQPQLAVRLLREQVSHWQVSLQLQDSVHCFIMEPRKDPPRSSRAIHPHQQLPVLQRPAYHRTG